MVKSANNIEESEQKQDGDDPKRPHETLEEREKAKIARFSQYVFNPEAWFRIADELEAAMKLLEPQIERFWECFRADAGVVEKKDSEPPPKDSLINVHMMLAGFAIENLCKGHLAGRLTWKERKKVKVGELPKCLDGHKILKLATRTGMTLSEFERDLLARITEVIWWRGRYPAPLSHNGIVPFPQWGDDIGRIKTFLRKLRIHVGAKDS
jgi:hypothetical protein